MAGDPSHTLHIGDRESELAATLVAMRAQITTFESLATWIESVGSAVAVVNAVLSEPVLFKMISREDIESSIETVRRWLADGLDVRSVLDPHYPQNLRAIFNKPPLLFVRGAWDEVRDSRSVAVVGTRKPTEDGLRRAQRVAASLTDIGVTVLSGLAAGIDTAAHTSTLAAGGRTVAVLGSGFDHIYPRANRGLADRILERGGAIVSQFLPDQHPAQWTFPLRNVVMSGLSLATVVIEAGETSGARIQARSALQHGRTVFLLRSLVEQTPWARKLVDQGVQGVTAITVASPSEITRRLVPTNELTENLAV